MKACLVKTMRPTTKATMQSEFRSARLPRGKPSSMCAMHGRVAESRACSMSAPVRGVCSLSYLNQKLAEELFAVEISGSGVDAIAAKKVPGVVEVKKFDGYHIPYPDKYFDVASAIHVLEHVEHERMFLSEMARVAKTLIVEVPLEHTFRVNRSIQLGRPYGHINLYDTATFRNILETSGLNVEFAKTHSNSYAYEVCVSGKIEGAIKFSIRTAALRVIPTLAAKIMTYMRIARCAVR